MALKQIWNGRVYDSINAPSVRYMEWEVRYFTHHQKGLEFTIVLGSTWLSIKIGEG